MVARLILLLLLACLTLPAMATAPCHDNMAGMAMTPGDPAPAHKAITAHSCIGCIPPVTLMRHAVAPPPVAGVVRSPIAPARFDRGRAVPPALPPPRAGA